MSNQASGLHSLATIIKRYASSAPHHLTHLSLDLPQPRGRYISHRRYRPGPGRTCPRYCSGWNPRSSSLLRRRPSPTTSAGRPWGPGNSQDRRSLRHTDHWREGQALHQAQQRIWICQSHRTCASIPLHFRPTLLGASPGMDASDGDADRRPLNRPHCSRSSTLPSARSS